MTFNKLFEVVEENTQVKSIISNVSYGIMDTPFLMNKTVEMLADDSPYLNIISDENKQALVNMLIMYFNNCWGLYVEDYELDKLLKFGKIEVYKVDAPNGLRYATATEVAQGIKGLIGEYIYPATEENYKRLCLLQWTFSGVNYFFREAGFKLTYDNTGKPKETLYQMIQMSSQQLVDLFKWSSIQDNIDKALNQIKKMKKNKGFKYASYEKDEIEESISIKQLIYNIDKTFPRNSTDIDYRKAIALIIKAKKNIRSITPLEISFLRKAYDKKAMERSNGKVVEESNKLRDECELILNERTSGKIDPNHFAYKIISTLKNSGYKKCSVKQYDIIKDALNIISNYEEKKQETEDNKAEQLILDDTCIDNVVDATDTSVLTDISDALGRGLFDDD